MSKDNSHYILPLLEEYENLEDLINNDISDHFHIRYYESNNRINFDLLIDTPIRAFIIAKPGYGKSELLRQIKLIKEKKGVKVKKVTLKDLKAPSQILDEYEEDCLHYLFDALDEISYQQYFSSITNLNIFSRDYPNVSIFITCKLNDAINHSSDFIGFPKFKFIRIGNFSYEQILEFVGKFGLKDAKLGEILIEKVKSTDSQQSLLSVPRYLKTISDLIGNGWVIEAELKKWKRVDFFEKFIYAKLEAEEKKGILNTQNEKEITKRVLEKLALILEIYQTNSITKEEFITFLDETQSNINLVFLNTCNIDTFFSRVLQNRIELGKDLLEFQNTEFQEYLAAKELNRLASTPQVIYDLIIQPEFNQIFPNWYDVLRYLVELDPKHLIPLIEYLGHRKETWVENAFWGLLSGADSELLPAEEKKLIFLSIYEYVQKTPNTQLFRNEINLLKFFVPDALKTIISVPQVPLNKNQYRKLSNQLNILSNLIEREEVPLEQKIEWKEFLLRLASSDDIEGQELSIFHLAYFGELNDLENLREVFDKGNKKVRSAFIRACEKIDPSSEFSLNIFLKGLLDPQLTVAIDSINKISDPKILHDLVQRFLDNPKLIEQYIRKRKHYITLNEFGLIDNIGKSWSKEFEKLLFELLQLVFTKEFQLYDICEEFEEKLIQLLVDKNPKLLLNILEISEELSLLMIRQIETFRKLLTPNNTESFVKKVLEMNGGPTWWLIDIFLKSYNPKTNIQTEVFQIGEILLPEISNHIKSPEELASIQKEQEDKRKSTIYTQFQKQLEPEPDKIQLSVFDFFVNHKDVISEKVSDLELERLRTYLVKLIPQIRPIATKIKKVRTDARNTSITINRDVIHFDKYLKAADALDILQDIKIPRKNLLEFLPLTFESSPDAFDQNILLSLIGNLTEDDQSYLLKVLSERNDDFLRYSPIGFARGIAKFQAQKLAPILKALIDDSKLQAYERVEVFNQLIILLEQDEKNLKLLLVEYRNYEIEEIARKAIDKIILLYEETDAINIRIQKIIKLAQPFEQPVQNRISVIRSYSDWEQEMDKGDLAQPLIKIQNKELAPQMLDLLGFGLQKFRMDEKFQRYCQYLMKIVYDYYEALKAKVSYSFLQELLHFLDTNHTNEKSLFDQYRTQLQISYISYHDKPKSINSSINKYNYIKAKTYLPVYNANSLNFLIQETIKTDIQNYVYQEGFYQVVQDYFKTEDNKTSKKSTKTIREDYIQKTIKIQLENALLKKGIREIDILREPQLLDNKRIDLRIKYGFIPPIIIEIKLLHNSEITNSSKRTKYLAKLEQYMQSQNSNHLIYLIFKVKEGNHEKNYTALREEYKNVEGLFVMDFIDCTKYH